METLQRAEKEELLYLLEEKRRRHARDNLSAYCRYIEIPGAPVNENEECEEFYPDSVTPAAHHELLNAALTRVESGEIRRLLVVMPPGSAKSTYGTVTFPTWYIGKKRGRQVITASYNSDLAYKFSRRNRSIVRSKQYREIFDTELTQDNRAAQAWSLTNGSSLMAAGLLAGITGNRADGIVIDDPLKGRQDADSKTIRETIWNEYLASVRSRLKPRGFVVLIQTRWHEDDLAGRILPKNYAGESGWVTARDGEQWYVIRLPAQCDRDDDPLGRKIGEWLWTDWFPPEHWEQEKKSQGSRNWAALYQGSPRPDEGDVFKKSWCSNRYSAIPVAATVCVHTWDTAQKEKDYNDPTAGGFFQFGPGAPPGYYLREVYKDRVDYPTLRRKVIAYAERDKPHAILIEDKSSGQSLIQDLRNSTSLPIIAIEPEGNKLFRAQEVSPMVEAGLLHLPVAGSIVDHRGQTISTDWLIDFEAEFFGFPIGSNDDQVDMTTQFLKWVRGWLGRIETHSAGMKRTLADEIGKQSDEGYGSVGRFDGDTNGFM